MSQLTSILAGIVIATALALPRSTAAQTSDFGACVARIEALAMERGISQATTSRVLPTVRPLERVIRADRNQPEFVATFADYLGRRVTANRVATGRALLAEHADLLRSLTARYGVPAQYLVAFWGLESNFGGVLGNVPVFDALGTLACDQRRSDYFTTEFIHALSIVERGDVEPARMIGSWAGAMGQTQFMPSVYLEHAADGDGDGRVDIWASAPDALASAARFLAGLGWESGYRWGREVLLPQGFDYTRAGLREAQSLADWRALGIRDANGDSVPALDVRAALLVPAGSSGPAFLVYDNFRVIMRWNNSEFFALTIGHLADRIAGAGTLVRPPPATAALTRDQLQAIQAGLNVRGFDAGSADGILGPATRAAIAEFQSRSGLVADGFPTPALLETLGID